MNKIAVIIPYFGKSPDYMPLNFHSCKKNDFIDWYFFTDCLSYDEYGENLFFEQISFADYCKNASKILNIDFTPEKTIKLCDLKPFYGKIHEKTLKNYDFWGFADIDTVWGDLAHFYTPELLKNFDVFSTHSNMISGHFCLMRNNEKYVNLCFKISDWQNKLLNQNNLSLDEVVFANLMFPPFYFLNKFMSKIVYRIDKDKKSWKFYSRFVQTFIHSLFCFKHKRLYFKEQFTTASTTGDFSDFDSDVWFYKNGKVYNKRFGDKKEFIYFHWMNFKKLPNFKYNLPDNYQFENGVQIGIGGFNAIK